jgi:periplasmic protein TonB
LKPLAAAGLSAILFHAGLLLINLHLFPRPLDWAPRQVLIELPETPPSKVQETIRRTQMPEKKSPPRPVIRPEPAQAPPSRPAEPTPETSALPAPAVVADDPNAFSRAVNPPLGKTITEGKPAEASAPLPASSGKGAVLTEAFPLYQENPAPAYPALARKRGYEGTVVLEVFIGRNGRVLDLKVHQSSGYAVLDEAPLAGVKHWRFQPGKRGETPIDMWVRVPICFTLR